MGNILLTALTESEARLHDVVVVPGGRKMFIRKWEYVDATYADDLIQAAPSTVTNPYVDAQMWPGTYTVKTERGQGQDDRSVTIFQRLAGDNGSFSFFAEHATLIDTNAYVYPDWPTVIQAPPDEIGTIYQATNSPNEDGTYNGGLTYTYSTAATPIFASRQTAFRREDTYLYKNSKSLVSAPDVYGAGMYDVSADMNRDGTYDERLVYMRGTANPYIQFMSTQGTLHDEKTYVYKDSNDVVHAPADVQGTIYKADNAITDIGTYNSQILYRTSTPVTAQFKFNSTAFRTGTAWIYDNQVAPVAAPTITGSGMYESKNEFREDGTYGGILMYQGGSETGFIVFGSAHTYLDDQTTWLYKDSPTFIEAPADAQGSTYKADNNITEIGTYNSQFVNNTSTDVTVVSEGTNSLLSDTTIKNYHNARTMIVPTAAAQGTIYVANQRMNDDKTYTGQMIDATSKEFYFYDTWIAPGGDLAWLYGFKNVRDLTSGNVYGVATNLLGQSAGSDESFGVSANEDGTYDATARHIPGRFGSTFAASPADWLEVSRNTRPYPGDNLKSYYQDTTWHMYSQFFGTRAGSATFITNGVVFGMAHNPVGARGDKPLFSHGLWEGVYGFVQAEGAWTVYPP